MPEDKKKSGLSKEISTIFSGLPEVANGRGEKTDSPPAPAGSTAEKSETSSAVTPLPFSEEIVLEGAFPRRRNASFGLDIGLSSIILVQVCPVASGWEIGGYAIKEIRLARDKEGLEEEESLLRQIKEMVAAAGCKGSICFTSLRGDAINTSLIPLARMPQKELESACRLEAKRRVSFSVEKALIRLQLVAETAARPGGKVNYLVSVARREMVRRRLTILQGASLRVGGLIPLPFAWKYILTGFAPEDKSVAVVEISSDRTQIVVYKGGEIRFSREFEAGGDGITGAIIQAAASFGDKSRLSWQEAEHLKREVNIIAGPAGKTIKGGVNSGQMLSMMRPVLEKIVQESKRSLDYYSQLFRGEEVGEVYLSGGGALLPGLLDFFQERIRPRIKLFPLPPRINLHSSLAEGENLKKIFPRLAKAVGVALVRKPEMDFMPAGDKLMENILHRKAPIVILAGVALFFSFYYYHRQAASLPPLRRQIAANKKNLVKIKEQLPGNQVLAELESQLENREKLGQYSSLRQPNWKGIFKELARLIPRNIILSRVSLEETVPQRIVCAGRITRIDRSLDSELSNFLVQAGNSPFFREVTGVSLDIDNEKQTGEFRFKCVLVY